jgi:hypothetical protein
MAEHRETIRAPGRDERSGSDRAPADEPQDLGAFTLCGEIDGTLVRAAWSAADGLECSPALLERARVVVGLGETFAGHHGGPRRAATLDGPRTAMLLTLMRACTTVISVEAGYDP